MCVDGWLPGSAEASGRKAQPLPSFLPPVLPSWAPDSDLSRIASVGGICIFFFFLLPLVYHKKISQSHAHLKSSTIQGRVGGMEIGRIL